MQIQSKIIKLENINDFSTENIEKCIRLQNIEPLRWAIVKIKSQNVHINVAFRAS